MVCDDIGSKAHSGAASTAAAAATRSDLALILDPKTPLDQAVQLATAAAKTAAAAAAASVADAPAAQQITRPFPQQQQQQQCGGVRSSSSIKRPAGRQAGEAAVEASPAKAAATAATAATVAAATAAAAAAGAKAEEEGDDGFAGFVSAPRREGPEPPAHLVCPITLEVGFDMVTDRFRLLSIGVFHSLAEMKSPACRSDNKCRHRLGGVEQESSRVSPFESNITTNFTSWRC